MEFGFLQEVDVRALRKHEQYDFSNWLAQEKNIELLNDILGLTLVDIEKEAYVGAYRCDLVAKDDTTGIKIIIENQLEASNHDHLGKIITYASGLNANVIVWIVTQAREEHRSAIEWLNNNTNSEINFFLLELHAYKIGNSLPAPKFETVEKPNGFIKYAKGNGGNGEISEAESERLAFWSMFNDIVELRGKPFNIRKPTIRHWYNVSIGKTGASISINLVNKESSVVLELYIDDNKQLFDMLYEERNNIESELGFKMEWQRLNHKKASRIKYAIPGLDFSNHSNYEMLMNQIVDNVIIMRKVFAAHI